MAYVVPDTDAQFFCKTGLSPSHENTLYFATVDAKNSYFDNWDKYVVTDITYQRENIGFIRVQLPVSSLIRCDYMRFRNSSFEGVWFYAFITQVNYINNITTEVQYKLDPFMTYMGAFSLKQCYVARQHTVNDGIGNNIAEEGIPVGNYITEGTIAIANTGAGNIKYRLAVSDGGSLHLSGGIPTGCTTYDYESIDALQNKISELVDDNETDSILGIYTYGTAFGGSASYTTMTHAKPYSSIGGGYVPKNNKLYCYPYKYCTLDNGEGSTQDFMYEYFETVPSATSSGNFSFYLYGCNYATGLELLVIPKSYKYNGGDSVCSEYRMTQTHFPTGSFAVDSYKAYLAQKNAYFPQEKAIMQRQADTNAVTSGLKGAVSGLESLGQGNLLAPLAGITGALGGMANSYIDTSRDIQNAVTENMTINQIRPESPSIEHGTPSSDILFSTTGKRFYLYEKSITRNYAQMIDDYFTMYGYAVKQVMTPNMNARPHWTYVKTIGCNVNGEMPASDAREIESIFDNGVRLWHNLNEMGDYSLDNSPA